VTPKPDAGASKRGVAPPSGQTEAMSSNLGRDAWHGLLSDAAERVADFRGDRVRAVFPTPEALAGLDDLPGSLPTQPTPAAEVLELLDRLGSPAAVKSTGGRYFGFVNGGTEPVAVAASLLATGWDQNTALPIMSPIAAHLDAIGCRWVTELLGLPKATASFCAGASVANLTCLIAARDALLHRAGWNVDENGLASAPPLRVVTSAEVHVSVFKALRAAGFGRQQITFVPTDDCGRLIASEMPEVDAQTLVILQAGNVNTGHSDPFAAVIPAARNAGAWIHIDGAFGLWAAAAPLRRPHIVGYELADSWATDAHKWLNAPYDAAVAICADATDLRRAMAVDAAYLPADAARVPMHLGLQMSQRARGVETWAIITALGRDGIADAIERSCRHAEVLATGLADAGVEILAPVVLNQALARFGDDEMTQAVIEQVQTDGRCWAGGTTWKDKAAMRLSVSDTSTTDDDIAVATSAIIDCWRQVQAGANLGNT